MRIIEFADEASFLPYFRHLKLVDFFHLRAEAAEDDLLDEVTVNYTFTGNKLVYGGYITWEVVKMTDNTMVLKTNIIGAYQETTFRKR